MTAPIDAATAILVNCFIVRLSLDDVASRALTA
jgi:hypothetical protein